MGSTRSPAGRGTFSFGFALAKSESEAPLEQVLQSPHEARGATGPVGGSAARS